MKDKPDMCSEPSITLPRMSASVRPAGYSLRLISPHFPVRLESVPRAPPSRLRALHTTLCEYPAGRPNFSKVRNGYLVALIGVVVMLAAPGVPGAEEPREGREAVAPSEDEEEAAMAQEAEKESSERSPDTFTPTEEISEDLSVSFPVDI